MLHAPPILNRPGIPLLPAATVSLVPVLLSVVALLTGNSLVNTLVPLRATLENFPPLVIGLLGSAMFAGMLAGTIATPYIVRAVGHIRAYAAFVSIAIAATAAYPIVVTPEAWTALRMLMGFVFAGLFSTMEGWVHAKANNENRGRLFGLYQLAHLGGAVIGQQFIPLDDPRSFALFSAAGIAFALSILPLTLIPSDPPNAPETVRLQVRWLWQSSPVAAANSLMIGCANGAFWTLSPAYGIAIGLTPAAIAAFTTAVLIGTLLAVLPVGRLSDRIDRRIVLLILAGIGVLCEIVLWLSAKPSIWLLFGAGIALGMSAIMLGSVGASHANDRSEPGRTVAVSSTLLFLYCCGAIICPTIAAWLMEKFGPATLFLQNAILHSILAAFIAWRIIKRAPAAQIADPAARKKSPITP